MLIDMRAQLTNMSSSSSSYIDQFMDKYPRLRVNKRARRVLMYVAEQYAIDIMSRSRSAAARQRLITVLPKHVRKAVCLERLDAYDALMSSQIPPPPRCVRRRY